MANLPYVTAPGNIDKALTGIRAAATPERVSQDFVKTILKIKGGSGDQITSFLKKIGFAAPDGSPTNIYKKFRNPATSGEAAAEALKSAYAPLYVRNEYMHRLSDDDLRGLIIEETGLDHDAAVVSLVFASINAIKSHAKWSSKSEESKDEAPGVPATNDPGAGSPPLDGTHRVGMNLSYTINLNLPATSDVAVFNAIFKSLKENLLRDENE